MIEELLHFAPRGSLQCLLSDRFGSRCFLPSAPFLVSLLCCSVFYYRLALKGKESLRSVCFWTCVHQNLSTSVGICSLCLAVYDEGSLLIRSRTTQAFRGAGWESGPLSAVPQRDSLPEEITFQPAGSTFLLPLYHLLLFHRIGCVQPGKG